VAGSALSAGQALSLALAVQARPGLAALAHLALGDAGSVIGSPCSLISFSNAVSDPLYLEYALLIDVCCNGSVVVKDALW
jgi:hypothetical protein